MVKSPTVDTIQLAGIIVPAAVAILLAVYASRRGTKRDQALIALQNAQIAQAAAEASALQAEALSAILHGIEFKVDGRLETALQKIDRLEGIISQVTGVDAPPPVAGQNEPQPQLPAPDPPAATVVTTVIDGTPTTITKTTTVPDPPKLP